MRGINTVWEALASARNANLAAEGGAAAEPGRDGETRRAVLKALGATGMVAALPQSARAAPPRGRVAIVGGGIAGLSALWHLREAGIDAHLYEARARLGGRMFTHRPANGVAMEIGGQLVNSDHADMHALVKAFDVPLLDRKTGPHRPIIVAGGKALSSDALVDGLRGIAGQIGRDSARLDRDYAGTARALDRLSIRAYLDLHAALIPDPWVRHLLESTSRTECGVEPDQASALQLVFNLPTVDGRAVNVLSRSDERFKIAGGSSALIDAMGARLKADITTGKRLTRIASHGAGMRLTFLDGSTVDADEVIVAVPAPLMRQIDYRVPLSSPWRAYLAEVDLGRNEKVQAVLSSDKAAALLGPGDEVWQTDPAAAALGWNGSVRPATGNEDVWTWFLGGDEVTDDKDIDAAARRYAALIEGGLPGFTAAMTGTVRRTAWHRDPLTLGGYVNYRPGQLTRFADLIWVEGRGRGPIGTGSRLHFAGEHLSDAFPGYMNGAAQTGRLAAEAVLAGHRLSRAA